MVPPPYLTIVGGNSGEVRVALALTLALGRGRALTTLTLTTYPQRNLNPNS